MNNQQVNIVNEDYIPEEMQSKPKIPRTPIPFDELEKVKKENDLIRKSMQIRVNEEANIKKRKPVHEDKKSPVSSYINYRLRKYHLIC